MTDLSFIYVVLSGADFGSAGRFDRSMLSDQSLMELFVANISNKNLFLDKQGDFVEIKKWRDIIVNEDERVVEIGFYGTLQEGTLDFECIPTKSRKVIVGDSDITGEVPWSKLPDGIEYLILYGSKFFGTVDLTVLPRELIELALETNNFSGTLDFSHLPKNLIGLDLQCNAFVGRIDLREISGQITDFSSEHMDLEFKDALPDPRLPFGISLNDNKFEGDILVSDLSRIVDNGQFKNTSCEFLVDAKGDVQKVNHQTE